VAAAARADVDAGRDLEAVAEDVRREHLDVLART
jgi:hypothetical protein